eukprot:3090127-Ditylum_brightwellii.AAC.1
MAKPKALEHSEVAHWIDIAMQDFKYCIIEWKEEEDIRLVLEACEEMERNMVFNEDDIGHDRGNGPDSSA